MAELDPRSALDQARAMLRYVESFNGQKFDPTFDEPDRRNLAVALDHLMDTAAMLLNMSGRVSSTEEALKPYKELVALYQYSSMSEGEFVIGMCDLVYPKEAKHG